MHEKVTIECLYGQWISPSGDRSDKGIVVGSKANKEKSLMFEIINGFSYNSQGIDEGLKLLKIVNNSRVTFLQGG
jgi:hypothetical protein